mmetsp:Transcript_12717/g.21134  ORF Transcript_12717/g.21134 Transcript_12717/m.21134 type:complete len:205 (-) Transcript_12717:120-734(-)
MKGCVRACLAVHRSKGLRRKRPPRKSRKQRRRIVSMCFCSELIRAFCGNGHRMMTSSRRLYRRYLRNTGTAVLFSAAYSSADFNRYFELLWPLATVEFVPPVLLLTCAGVFTLPAPAPVIGLLVVVGLVRVAALLLLVSLSSATVADAKYLCPFLPSMRKSGGISSISTILASWLCCETPGKRGSPKYISAHTQARDHMSMAPL